MMNYKSFKDRFDSASLKESPENNYSFMEIANEFKSIPNYEEKVINYYVGIFESISMNENLDFSSLHQIASYLINNLFFNGVFKDKFFLFLFSAYPEKKNSILEGIRDQIGKKHDITFCSKGYIDEQIDTSTLDGLELRDYANIINGLPIVADAFSPSKLFGDSSTWNNTVKKLEERNLIPKGPGVEELLSVSGLKR